MEKQSLGLIETWGWIPAVEAADAGTKSADVRLLDFKTAGRGLVTVQFLGDVAAVQAAVAAGAAAARRVGTVVALHVIPRPDAQVKQSVFPPEPPALSSPPSENAQPVPEEETPPKTRKSSGIPDSKPENASEREAPSKKKRGSRGKRKKEPAA